MQLWDSDTTSEDDSLGYGVTDNSGFFSIGPVSNVDEFKPNRQDVYVVALARNDAAEVRPTYDGNSCRFQGPPHSNVASGVFDTSLTLTAAQSGAFFVADALQEAWNRWTQLRPGNQPYRVNVEWRANYEQTHYNDAMDYIHIEAGTQVGWAWPDTFDRDVIRHEYCHRLEHEFGFFDEGRGDHFWDSLVNPRVAATEGAATALAAVLQAYPGAMRYNTFNDFVDSFWVNLENGQYGYYGSRDTIYNSGNNYGRTCEAAVAGILWDIFDSNNDDFSTMTLPVRPNPYQPDGVGDTLSDGAQHILQVVLDRYVNGQRPDSIDAFKVAWLQNPSLGHKNAMTDIWYEHGIDCCTGTTGDANMSGMVDLGDLTYLVGYLTNGAALPCHSEGNVNAVGIVDAGDLSALLAYFDGNYTLPPCPPAPMRPIGGGR